MGKPYQNELLALDNTFAWALGLDLQSTTMSLAAATQMPLIAVGSGGSLAACHFAAQLHQEHCGSLARAMTPLEFIQSAPKIRNSGTLILSAGGRNPDIVDALKSAIQAEFPRIIVICGRSDSPLAALARASSCCDLHSFSLPSGKDGFLATNSLLAFFVILHRSYTATQTNGVGISAIIPPTSSAFLHLKEVCRKLWNRQYFVILCGPSMVSAGIDLESRFTEAAIGATQLADYRNFAHGRHYWLAKHRSETAVVAFVAEEDRDLATRTLALIPSGIPCVGIDIDGPGLAAAVAGVWTSIYLAGLAGVAKGLDPGRPKVPPFGRKLYHLRRTTHRKAATAADWERLLITRKARQSPSALIANNTFGLWEAALRNFRDRMRDGRFKALVCDYDGTLCHQRERFTGISNGLAAELVRCLRGGMRIGIATGRGKSVRGDLRKVIPRALWNRVVVGYYNGSALGRLDGSEDPSHSAQTSPEVQAIVEVLSLNPPLGLKASISVRPFQITLETAHSVEQLWEVVHGIVSRCAPTLQVLRSAHSIDVLDSNASKANVVAEIGRTTEGRMGEILLIGDKGRWPGNDYALLAGKYSLSVDESSLDPETCWHLAPRGYLGPRATLHYLRSLRRSSGGLFRLTEI